MRPCDAISAGSAARTTAAVARRLTVTTRSHVTPETSSSEPGTSVPAHDTTPARSGWRAVIRSTVHSAARVSMRSTISWSTPSTATRSITTGVPPRADTASTTAAPSPDAPPVTRMVPSSSPTAHPLDQPRRRPAFEIRDDHHRTAPLLERSLLRDLTHSVVPALDEHARADAAQRLDGCVLVEDLDRVDAGQALQHSGPVALGYERTPGPLQATDRVVGVEQDDEVVAEGARGAQ